MGFLIGFAVFIGWIGLTVEVFKKILDLGWTAYMMLASTWVFGSPILIGTIVCKLIA